MITDPETVHACIAAGATDAATLISQNPTLPSVSRLEIEYLHTDDAPRILCQLAASTTELANLATWADVLDVDTATVTRYETPVEFTSVSLYGQQCGSLVRLWTHPSPLECDALTDNAITGMLEPGITATISLRALRAAADDAAERESIAGDAA